MNVGMTEGQGGSNVSEETKDIEETKAVEEKMVEIPEQKEKTESEQKESFIRFRKRSVASREEQILSRIKDEDLMKYLEMEHERLEMMQSIKEAREKRIFTMIQLLISLAAIVIVVFLLRDNPTVLVNILYIVGIIIVLWILKGPHEKNLFKKES